MNLLRWAVGLEFVVILALVASDLVQTYQNFQICSGWCDKNGIIDQLAGFYGPIGVMLWFPFEVVLTFGPIAIITWLVSKPILKLNKRPIQKVVP